MVTGGGVLVVSVLQDLLCVNMKTMTITVNGGEGLITKDSRRVDAEAQFLIRAADIASQQAIELAERLKAAEVAISSERQSQAEAAAAKARAKAIAAAESVNTARILAAAEREKDVAVLVAEQEAEQRVTALRVQARVEREAAEDQAAAVIAKAKADAIAARVEAENRISPKVMAHKERLAKIEALRAISNSSVSIRFRAWAG